VRWLVETGLNDCAISRATVIPRGTVRDWRQRGHARRWAPEKGCPICSGGQVNAWWYAYLLGLYLGDGSIATHPRGVFRLRIVLDQRYPAIIDECAQAIRAVRLSSPRVGMVHKIGCVEVNGYWKHWPCVFPQHGSGRKHLRSIALLPWQREIGRTHPERLLRGLIQSDGCRVLNRVNGTDYPRYMFTNNSGQIRGIFCQACDDYGVPWRQSNWKTISVARAAGVAKLDLVIGPKSSPMHMAPPSGKTTRRVN